MKRALCYILWVKLVLFRVRTCTLCVADINCRSQSTYHIKAVEMVKVYNGGLKVACVW